MSSIPSQFTNAARHSASEASCQIQMAIDSFLLARAATESVAVFRTYRMSPSAVTIGRHQRWRRVIDEDICHAHGWEFARRPTGGGALLHHDEINYAVVAPRGTLAPVGAGEFRAVFDVIGRALTAALEDMGYNPELHFGDRSDHVPQHGLCGRSITGNEIALGERKIIAAAQMVTPSGILQHGTIYLHAPDSSHRFWPVGESEREPSEFIQRWADLGQRFDNRAWTDVAAEFDRGFRRHLTVATARATLSLDDWTQVGKICDGWNVQDWHKYR